MDEKYLKKIFPEIEEIKNYKLQEGVIKIWLLAIKRGGWKRLDDIPFTLITKTQKKLLEHTRIVTQMAMAIARVRNDINKDTVIAGGLVHDVGKLVEYQKIGKRFIRSNHGKLVRHPISGYGLAIEVGLPLDVAHIVAVHSEEGEKVIRSREAILIHHCDFIDFDIEKNK